MNDEIAQLKRNHEEFVHIVAHDLSAPLRHIKDFTGLLLDSFSYDLTQEQKEYKQFIDKALSKLTIMQDDLLALSHITSRGQAFAEVRLDTAITNAADDLGLTVSYQASGLTVWGDAEQIVLAFRHLFHNALTYAQGDRALQVNVDVSSYGKGTEIAVRDNGIGFEEKYYSEIFKMFRRLHPAGVYGNGAGAGLAIVEKIMARHGGHIRVQSKVGEGTIFTLFFPEKS